MSILTCQVLFVYYIPMCHNFLHRRKQIIVVVDTNYRKLRAAATMNELGHTVLCL